jgi:hypothetical protein
MSNPIPVLFEGECPNHRACKARITDLKGTQEFLDLFNVECERTLSEPVGDTDGEVTFVTDCGMTYVAGRYKSSKDWSL